MKIDFTRAAAAALALLVAPAFAQQDFSKVEIVATKLGDTGEQIRVTHLPNAHTDGDAIVHFTGSDVMHMGDIFFNGMYPFIDYSGGGSIEGVIAAVDTAIAMTLETTKVMGRRPIKTEGP